MSWPVTGSRKCNMFIAGQRSKCKLYLKLSLADQAVPCWCRIDDGHAHYKQTVSQAAHADHHKRTAGSSCHAADLPVCLHAMTALSGGYAKTSAQGSRNTPIMERGSEIFAEPASDPEPYVPLILLINFKSCSGCSTFCSKAEGISAQACFSLVNLDDVLGIRKSD